VADRAVLCPDFRSKWSYDLFDNIEIKQLTALASDTKARERPLGRTLSGVQCR